MGADSVLVKASLGESVSGAGADVPNLKPLYDSNANITKGFTNIIRGFIKGYKEDKDTEKVDKDNRLKPFNKVLNDTITSLYEQEDPLPQPFIDLLTSKAEGFQGEFEGVNKKNKGDTRKNARERARIMGELKRVTSEIKGFRENLQKFAIEKVGNLTKGQVDENMINPYMKAIDLKNFTTNYDNGDVSLDWDEEGHIRIQVKNYDNTDGVVSGDTYVTMASLNSAFPSTDKAHHSEFISEFTTSSDAGKRAGLKNNGKKDYKRAQQHEVFKGKLSTTEQFQNIVDSKIEGIGADDFATAFLSDINIPFAVLDNMFYDEDGSRVPVGEQFQESLNLDTTPDASGNQVINQADMDLAEKMSKEEMGLFKQNIDALVDAVTNVHNPAFNLDRSSDMVAGYFNGLAEQSYNGEFDASWASLQDKSDDDKTKTINW